MPEWSATRYLKYADERTRPCRDLAARIDADAPRTVIDLGCGPGNSTAVLAERWPAARITGLDSSQDMLDAARRDYPSMQWVRDDIVEWAAAPGPVVDLSLIHI